MGHFPALRRKSSIYRFLSAFIAFTFSFTSVLPPAYAQSIASLNLPVPGAMVTPSAAFVPVLLKGMTIHPDNPLQFDFIIDSGNSNFKEDQIKTESERLVKYFLASMTIPKDDLWVNLSPYEGDRIIPDELGKTELGRDMLAQDYILKQLTASLMYPEKELGKEFWNKVYKQAQEKFGTTEIPVDTFNKVWILPETATVYEHGQTVYIVDARLKVMLDSDYLAMSHNVTMSQSHTTNTGDVVTGDLVTPQIVREVILPAIEKEVNEGQNFAPLRQIYHSLILAKWYKETIKNSLLSKIYIDQKKIAGVNLDDATLKDQIYAQYMEAYKKGVFNYIKEDHDRLSNETIPRKYFSGGIKGDVAINRSGNLANIKEPTGAFRLAMRIDPQKKGRSSSPVITLSPEQRELLDQAASQFGLGEINKEYLAEQWRQSLNRGNGAQIKIILDENNPEDPGNFILASKLTDKERREWLGSFSFVDIKNTLPMNDVIVTLNSLDGGIGESLNRLKFKQERARAQGAPVDTVRLGAKGTDLGYDVPIDGKTVFVSIAEVKILNLIGMVEKETNPFHAVSFQPLVNYQSKKSYEDLLAKTYLYDRLDDSKPAGQKQSYRQKLEALKVQLPGMLEQIDLPWIEKNTGNITLNRDEEDFRYRQPGGHGQWGFYFLWNIRFTEHPKDEKTRIGVFYNGDNLNSRISKDIVGKMKEANWPIVKLTTVAMAIDKKGGKDGVRVVEIDGKKVYVPAQIEEADAKAVKQTKEFYAAGQENGFGEPGKQPFNTNIFYINETLLHDILTRLAAAIGEERFKEIISPSYIEKAPKPDRDGNQYIPIDGAIGTAMHNLNEFFMTSTDPNVRKVAADLQEKFGIDRLLYFVDVPRTEFFTPVKVTTDIFLQTHTDYYKPLDGIDWTLHENTDQGKTLTPPEITLGDPNDKENTAYTYWQELQNLIDAFGEQKVRELRSLVIKGKIKMVDARLKGNVEIINASGREVDLKQIPEMQAHIINGELVLDNIKVAIDEQGQAQVRSSSLV